MASIQPTLRNSALQQVATIGLDLAKYSVDFVGLDAAGRVLTRRQYSKGKLLEVTARMQPCRIGMEACCGAHHLGRQLLAQGHDVKLMPPKYVKPFRQARQERLAGRRGLCGGLSAADHALRGGQERGTTVDAVAAPLIVRGWWATPRN